MLKCSPSGLLKVLSICMCLLGTNSSLAIIDAYEGKGLIFSSSLCSGPPRKTINGLNILDENNAIIDKIFANQGDRDFVVYGGGDYWEFPVSGEPYSPYSDSFYLSRGDQEGIFHLYTGNWVTIRHAGADPTSRHVKICSLPGKTSDDEISYLEYTTEQHLPGSFSYLMIRPISDTEYLKIVEAYIEFKPKYIISAFPYAAKWMRDGNAIPAEIKARIVGDYKQTSQKEGERILLKVDRSLFEEKFEKLRPGLKIKKLDFDRALVENSGTDLSIEDLPFTPTYLIKD